MNLNTFPEDFRQEEIAQIFNLVLTGKFCQLVCVPGGGKATILRLMAINPELQKYHLKEKLKNTRIIYLDLHSLESFDRANVEKFILLEIDEKAKAEKEPMLLTKQLNRSFQSLIEKELNVIFLLDHFDEFQNQLPSAFYQILKGFRSFNKYKFGVVFGTRRDLKDLVDPHVLTAFYDFFVGNTLYLKIYDQKATEVMFTQIEEAFGQTLTPVQQKSIIKLTNGHAKLTKALAETIIREKISTNDENLHTKPLIKEALLELWLFLTAQEQQALAKIAQEQQVEKDDIVENLIRFDLLQIAHKQLNPLRKRSEASNETIEQFAFTIPLYEQFIKQFAPALNQEKITYSPESKEILKGTNVISELLSKQEYRLLRFLIQNEGKIIERSEIIEAVWPDSQVQEGISDEAIDQMIFRLRKKIEDEPTNPNYIQTVKGMGIRFSS